jgi:SNF2 family DNA or RNA helicase
VPKVFKAYVTAKTALAICLNGKTWLPLSGISVTQDTLTGNNFKARPLEKIPDVPKHIFKPWEHQQRTIAFLRSNGGGFALLGMGTGKTKTTIDILQNDPKCQCVLIACPKNIMRVWDTEFHKHAVECDSNFHLIYQYKQSWNSAKTAEHIAQQIEYAKAVQLIPVVIMNYDSVWREAILKLFLVAGFSHIVLDESHRIKSTNGEAAKGMWKIGDHYRGKAMFLMLTGTVMPHSPVDLWSQFRFYNPMVFGASFHRFKTRFCITGGFEGKQIVDFVNQDEMNYLLYQHGIRYGRDVVKIPEATHTFLKIDLEPEAMKKYKLLKEQMWVQLNSGELSVQNALVKSLRLSQFVSGSVPNDDGDMEIVSHAKEKALIELLSDMDRDEPVVIFARFRHDIDTIRGICLSSDVGRTVSELSGVRKELEEWQAGKTNVLIVHPKCGAEGVEFTRARYNIIYSLGYEGGTYKQLISRSHRHGQTRDVTFYYLQCAGTIDEIIFQALQKKDNITEDVLNELRRRS